MTYKTDSDFIKGIIEGDQMALNILYKNHYTSVSYFIFNNNGSEQDAKDIYQEAFILFYEKLTLESLTLTCSIGTFLFAISRRLWLKRLTEKRKYINGLTSDFEDDFTDEDLISKNETEFSKMQSAMNIIGNPCKEILEDYYVNELSMNSISEKYGYTNSDNAKNQKYKCLVRLKKLFFQSAA